jgi:thiol-disulfide isomerase/thioredoxin
MLALILAAAVATSRPASARDVRLQRWPAELAVPSLQMKDIEGKEWNLQSLRGKVVILNFWATWCAPCVDELPILNDLARSEFPKKKLVVLGVNFKESASAIQRFSNEHQFHYPILMDKSGEHFKKWTNGILPTTVLIDSHGKPRWRIVGELDRTDPALRQTIETMLEEQVANHGGRGAVMAK